VIQILPPAPRRASRDRRQLSYFEPGRRSRDPTQAEGNRAFASKDRERAEVTQNLYTIEEQVQMKQLIDSLQKETKKLKKEDAELDHASTKTEAKVTKKKKGMGGAAGLGDVLGNFSGAHEVRRASATLGFESESFGAAKVEVAGENPMVKARGRRTGRRREPKRI